MGSLQGLHLDQVQKKEVAEEMETSDDGEEEAVTSLDTLPQELLLHILQFLDVRFITETLSRVSARFAAIAANQETWRIRVARRWPGQYPAVATCDNTHPGLDTFNWTEAAISREEECRVWAGQGAGLAATVCSNAHYSSVDCVRVVRAGAEQVVVSGSRDRGINLWSMAEVRDKGAVRPTLKVPDAHKGWVWSFSSNSSGDLVSGSWDNTVKFWRLAPAALRETRKPVNLKVAVLSTDMRANTVVAGTYDKRVVIMDTREEVRRMTAYRSHTKPVLGVRLTDRHIVSLSEDQTVVIYDRAAGRRLARLTVPGSSFPLSLSLGWSSILVGDKSGGLHLIDTTHDRFELVRSYSTGHSGKVTSVCGGLGSVLTSSSAGDIRVHQPDLGLGVMATLTNPECGELAQVSYDSTPGLQTLAAGFSNNTVKIWTRRA